MGPSAALLLMVSLQMVLSACGDGGKRRAAQSSSEPFSQDPAPTLNFWADPASVAAGGSTTLNWNSTNSDSCVASGSWSGARTTAGSQAISGLRTTQTYSLSCSGPGGSTLREIQVLVDAQNEIVISLQASETGVRAGTQVELTWSTQNAASCEASGAWTGAQALNGTFTSPALQDDATFRLTCSAGGASAIAIVSVEVSDNTLRWSAPDENVDGTPLNDLAGFNVYWGSSSRGYVDSVRLGADARQYVVPLPPGGYYFSVTAINSGGEESDYSNEVLKQIF